MKLEVLSHIYSALPNNYVFSCCINYILGNSSYVVNLQSTINLHQQAMNQSKTSSVEVCGGKVTKNHPECDALLVYHIRSSHFIQKSDFLEHSICSVPTILQGIQFAVAKQGSSFSVA